MEFSNKKEINRTLFRGSFILLVSFGVFNGLNFLYHVFMARSLSVKEYGILAALFSIIYILGVFSESIQLVIARYISKEKNCGKQKNILKKSLKRAVLSGSGVFVIYLVISIFLTKLTGISYGLLVLNGLIIFVVFLSPVARGVMQGKKRFFAWGVNMGVESAGKVIFGLILVFLGFKIYGAVIGLLVATFFAFGISFFSIRDVLSSNEKKAKTTGIYGYSRPVFLVTLVITLFYSIDILIAKIIFPIETAGNYAIASILAKAVFWGTQPVSRAMFPIAAENGKRKQSRGLLANSFALLIVLVLAALTAFYFFPEFIIKIFSGKEIKEAADILFYLGLSMGLLSITNLIILYKLSQNKIKRYFFLLIFVLIEVMLLLFSKTLVSFSISMVLAAIIFLIGSCIILKE